MSDKANKEVLNRSYIMYLGVVLLAIAIVGRVLVIQLVEGVKWREMADNFTTVYRDIDAVRGNIYSDDGSMMATSVPIYEVRMDMMADGLTDEIFQADIDSLCLRLSQLFRDRSAEEWERELMTARQN